MANAPVLFLFDKKCQFSLNHNSEKSDHAILLLGAGPLQISQCLRNTCYFWRVAVVGNLTKKQ